MPLLSDTQLIDRIFAHVDGRTSDKGDSVWREPAANYSSEARFQAELQVMRRLPVVFCPSGAVAGPGDYVARVAAGVPLLIVRGEDGVVRAFRKSGLKELRAVVSHLKTQHDGATRPRLD